MISKNKIQLILSKSDIKENLIKFSFLAQGNHNDNYLIETAKGKYVLRIEKSLQFRNLRKEYKILQSLREGLGPKVYLFDLTGKIIKKNYLVEEFISGKHPKIKVDDNFIKLMAKWFKQLHKIKLSANKGYSLINAIKPYYNNFKKYNYTLDDDFSEKIARLFKEVLKLCRENDKIFFSDKKFSLLHRDCSRDNIILSNNNVRLIDWEFSGYGVPEWDLIYFLQSYKFEKHHEKLFLDVYGYPNTQNSRQRLKMISLLNICGGIGYSLWRLALIKQGKVGKEEKLQTFGRINKDVGLLKSLLNN